MLITAHPLCGSAVSDAARRSPALGAELEHDDGEHLYFRFGADDRQHLRIHAADMFVPVG